MNITVTRVRGLLAERFLSGLEMFAVTSRRYLRHDRHFLVVNGPVPFFQPGMELHNASVQNLQSGKTRSGGLGLKPPPCLERCGDPAADRVRIRGMNRAITASNKDVRTCRVCHLMPALKYSRSGASAPSARRAASRLYDMQIYNNK